MENGTNKTKTPQTEFREALDGFKALSQGVMNQSKAMMKKVNTMENDMVALMEKQMMLEKAMQNGLFPAKFHLRFWHRIFFRLRYGKPLVTWIPEVPAEIQKQVDDAEKELHS